MDGTGNEFMKKTHYRHLGPSDQMNGVPQPPLEIEYDVTGTVIDLPDPGECSIEPITIREAIGNRRSVRKFDEKPMSLPELSYLLWCTQGVKKTIPGTVTFRTVPSAGARHAFETSLLVNNVDGLNPGLYRYLALEHKLLEIESPDTIKDDIIDGCLGQKMTGECAVTFIWTSVVQRMAWRYGDRGYRYLHLDAGHVCQNLYLAAETIHCGVCAIAAFDDDVMSRVLGLDGEQQFVIYIAVAGRKP